MNVKIQNSKMLWPHWWQAQTAILLLYIPTKSAYESHTKELSRVELYLWTHTSLLQPTHNNAFWQDFVWWQFIYWPSLHVWQDKLVKFLYSKKATKFYEISTIDLTVTTYDKSTVGISQNCVAFSEYMNFNTGYGST